MGNALKIRPVEPERDFEQLATLFTNEQGEPTTKASLMEDYEQHKERIFRLMAVETPGGELIGFNWAVRSRFDASQAYFYLIVEPSQRRKGAGSQLYQDLISAIGQAEFKKLEVSIRDNCQACRRFAEQRGFKEKTHLMAMALDLGTFEDTRYDGIIDNLNGQGFQFTSMEALGNTEEAQRKLYTLNNATAMDVPGTDGEPSWLSFEDFQKTVCQANWYRPGGQMVVIDTATGQWAGLSAITRFEGADYAYNLHTGVDRNYRGRKLGQAVKVMALRYAREVLKVKTVQTHHNDKNQPMIAIDRKFGYIQIPGVFTMVKEMDPS
jgi:L-amino acid N-acyltransferase YncA